MNSSVSGKVLSPWEMTTSFIDLWDWNKLSWIILTILLVYFLYKISTRTIRGKKASWREFLLHVISTGGWLFLMYMVMWDIMKVKPSESIALLIFSCGLSFIGYLIFFRVLKNPEKKEWASRIVSGIILSVIVFGVFIFMGSGEQALGLAGLMGGLLGSLLSLAWYNLINMIRYDGTKIEEPDDDKKWTPPRP